MSSGEKMNNAKSTADDFSTKSSIVEDESLNVPFFQMVTSKSWSKSTFTASAIGRLSTEDAINNRGFLNS